MNVDIDKVRIGFQKDINEVVDINGSKVYIEDGEVKIQLNEDIERTGYMSVDEMFDLIDEEIKAIYAMNDVLQGQ